MREDEDEETVFHARILGEVMKMRELWKPPILHENPMKITCAFSWDFHENLPFFGKFMTHESCLMNHET